ncbi:MAG: hypothetical protein DRH26_02015 [Deltaproteobacteria bacterium]|nr:MAG: hypothetical protein DRH26_02015 [Deltaproteobacteria bacterium]
MTPSKLDIKIWRGTTYELELISQVKNYIYDPDINNDPLDLQRTHKENIDYYGFVYEYIDFIAIYSAAELIIRKPWIRSGAEATTPLMTLSLANGDIELTDQSVKIGIDPDETKIIEFDAGTFELLLTTSGGKVDSLIFGDVEVLGKVQSI